MKHRLSVSILRLIFGGACVISLASMLLLAFHVDKFASEFVLFLLVFVLGLIAIYTGITAISYSFYDIRNKDERK